MRYEPLPSSFFAGNREELASRLPAGSMLILHANDVFPTNADGTFALHQNANLFYLTGVDQEETVLVMTIREDGWDEILLLRETNEQIAIWEGARLSQEQARELSGIQDVRWTDEYDALLEALVPSASMVFVEANQHPRCTCPVETRNAPRNPSICHSPTPGLMNRSNSRKPSLVMSQAFLRALISSGFLICRMSAKIS